MPQSCAVPSCSSKGSGHRFPKDKTLLQEWISALGIMKVPAAHWRVCKKHFLPEDYTLPKESVRQDPRPLLKKTAVPSVFRCNNQPPPPEKTSTSVRHTVNILRKKKLQPPTYGRNQKTPMKIDGTMNLESNQVHIDTHEKFVIYPIKMEHAINKSTIFDCSNQIEPFQCKRCPNFQTNFLAHLGRHIRSGHHEKNIEGNLECNLKS